MAGRRRKSKKTPVWLTVLTLMVGALCYLALETTVFDPLLEKTGLLATLKGNTTTSSSDSSEPTGLSESPATSRHAVIAHLERPVVQGKRPSQLIEHIAYTVDYNPKWNIPNWVAYCLTAEETQGGEERADHFKPDPLVKGDPVVTKDYSNSGYDRGHMAPAADFKWSEEAMRESFYMTNMCPQNHNLNAGDWKELEELVRCLAAEYGCIYVCCGPVVNSRPMTIGSERKIVVPAAFFKTLLRQKADGSWTGIGFLFANKAGNRKLQEYAMTIDELETTAGIDFFPLLDDKVETAVEADYSLADWRIKDSMDKPQKKQSK